MNNYLITLGVLCMLGGIFYELLTDTTSSMCNVFLDKLIVKNGMLHQNIVSINDSLTHEIVA